MLHSLVDRTAMKRDPRKLAFLYPKMPVKRYKELTEDYHRKMALMTVEQVTNMFDCVLLPASCIHHSRRVSERRLLLHGKTYYVYFRDDVTELEWAKYQALGGYTISN
jgi:hypothetical protein